MNKNKLIVVWGSLLFLFLIMIFVEIKTDEKAPDPEQGDEVIYWSYNDEPTDAIDIPENFNPLETIVQHEKPAEIAQDLGRLAVSSVIINKKPAKQAEKGDQAEIQPSNLALKQQDLSFKIFQGHRFNAVLTHAIQSDLPGMVVAEISQDIYGYQSNIALLPKGTRLIGQYNNRLKVGDTRLYIVWQRAITPTGIDIPLESIGTDRLGQTGLTGDINTHFWETFGTSSLLSVMAVGASNLSSEQGEMSNQYQQAVTDSLMETSESILVDRLNRKPTIHVHQGEVIHVMVAKDLDFTYVFKQTQQIPIF